MEIDTPLEELNALSLLIDSNSNGKEVSSFSAKTREGGMMRFEFIEAICRLALDGRNLIASRTKWKSLSELLSTFLTEVISFRMEPEMIFDAEVFRNDKVCK